MKTVLTFCFIITFHFSTFAQIDTSAWEGKTVLVVVKTKKGSTHTDYYNKEFAKNWYLTDSIQFIADTLIKRDLNDFGTDTVIIVWKTDWQKVYANKNCMPTKIPEDCMIWTLTEHFEFKNFQNNKWETYVFPIPNEKLKPVQKFQKLITNSKYLTSYNDKIFIKKNQPWTKEIQNWVDEKFYHSDFRIAESRNNKYINKSIYIYWQHFPHSNIIEIVDLKTNRVIEKIKIE